MLRSGRASEQCADTLWEALCSEDMIAYGNEGLDYRLGFMCGRRSVPAFARTKMLDTLTTANRQLGPVNGSLSPSAGYDGITSYGCWGWVTPGVHWKGCSAAVFWSNNDVSCRTDVGGGGWVV